MSKIKEIIKRNHKCRIIPPEDAEIDFDIDKTEAEIEAEFQKRKEEWKKELLEKLPSKENLYKEGTKEWERIEGFYDCLFKIKKLIEGA